MSSLSLLSESVTSLAKKTRNLNHQGSLLVFVWGVFYLQFKLSSNTAKFNFI